MGRRTDHTRTELRQMMLDAATGLIDRYGLAGLSARAVAREIGYSVGTLYNLFDDLDDLVWQVNGRTLDALRDHLATAATGAVSDVRVRRLAQAYLDFVAAHPRRWAAILESRPRDDGEPPRWYRDRIRGLFDLAEAALSDYFPAGAEAERRRSAQVLWAGLTGIALLIETSSVPADTAPHELVASLVATHLAGLASTAAGGAGRQQRAAPKRSRVSGQ